MWVNTMDASPKRDGYYLCQFIYGNVSPLSYTVDGGWNTSWSSKGDMRDNYRMSETNIARWYEIDEPEPIPDAWNEAPYYDTWDDWNADFGRDEITYDNLTGTFER